MQLLPLIPATLLLATASAQEATWKCPGAPDKDVPLVVGSKTYKYKIKCDTQFLGDEITRFYANFDLKACAKACSEHQDNPAPCESATIVKVTGICILRSSVGEVVQSPYVECALLDSFTCK